MNDIIFKLVDELRAEIKSNYEKQNLVASGRFGNELKTVNKGGSIAIVAPHYAVQMILGRRSGKRPPVKAIKQWIKDKNRNAGTNIPEDAAYAIAKKIGEEGVKVPNHYNNGTAIKSVITDERVKRLVDDMLKVTKAQILNILK
ncbi:hypothetical protein PM21P1_00032 [Parabacteroides phage PM21P1]|nr:hypothetical protein PM21P1_00032 [Parabacteroides phage PM21P1]